MNRIVRAARLVDGAGGVLERGAAVEIEDGCIRAVRPSRDGERAGTGDLDLGDVTLLPGLIDAHLHLAANPNAHVWFDRAESPVRVALRAAGNALHALRAGITTVCDAGGPNDIVFALRDAIRDGVLPGPRILASGAVLTPPGGHGIEVGRPTERGALRQAVREQIAAGADLIKIMGTGGGGAESAVCYYTADELRGAVREAASAGRRVIIHCHGAEGIRRAVKAGVARIEHCSFIDGERSEFDAALAAEIAERGIFVAPTNAIDYRRIERGRPGAPLALLNANWRQLREASVKLVGSSDAGVTDMQYGDYALVPRLMVDELGLTPLEAIEACTRVAAESLGLADTVGTLEPGKAADLIAAEGNPLKEIEALRRIRFVMRGGHVMSGHYGD